jgi:hypothetical protein
MTNYVATIYSSAASLETAIELLETSVTFDVIPYKEGCKAKFLMISPAPNAAV